MITTLEQRIDHAARRHLGLEELRPGQDDVVAAVVEGRDALAVMPTGWGKSAVYQMAAVLMDGPTVVVSPLLALQDDQVESLSDMDAGAAEAVNSTLTTRQRFRVLEEAGNGDVEFVFLSPEQLANPEVRQRITRAGPSLVVVDEAHCIAEWGYDFRPDYLRLGPLIESLGEPRPIVLALTATAAPPVRDEIVARLRLRDPHLTVLSFDRPNLLLQVETFADEGAKRRALIERVVGSSGSGIVYAATRRGAETVADELRAAGVTAHPYHAGLANGSRQEVHEAFSSGESDVVVATVAFGLGIDRPDVRFVHHLDVPESLDAYYQQIGRAGRDGDAAEAKLFFRPADLGRQRFLGAAPSLTEEDVTAVLAVMERHRRLSWDRLVDSSGLTEAKAAVVVAHLEDAGAVEVSADEVDVCADADAAAVDRVMEHADIHSRFERSRLQMMEGYATTHDCRREYLLNYFGESYEPPCGNCDNCRAGTATADDHGAVPFPLGSVVIHTEWGEGVVHRYERDMVVVLFDQAGYRSLGLDLVEDRGLLQQA